jgi:hypothetical protein
MTRRDADASADKRGFLRTPATRIAAGAAVLAGLALIAAAVKFSAFAPRATKARPQDLAAEFARSGDYLRSAETLRAAWRANPTDALRLEAARAFLIAGEEARAIDLLAAPASGRAEDFTRRHLLAEAELRSRGFDAASRIAAELLAEAPRDGRAKLLEARIAHGRGEFEKSRALLGESIRYGGDARGEAWLFRARLALDADDAAAARAAARRAREAGASASEIDAVEIETLLRAGAREAARAALAELNAARDGGGGPLTARLQVHLDICAGAANEAARRLRDIAPLVEAAPYGLLFISRVATLAADDAQGEAALAAALAAAPGNPVLLAAAHERRVRARRFGEAEDVALRLAGVDRDRAALARVAAALAEDDADTAAAAALGAEDFAEPAATDAFVFGAGCGADASAAAARARAVRLLAGAESARGELRAGAADAARALEAEATEPAAQLLAGEIRLALGDDAAAGAAFERARAARPGSARARIGRVRIAARAGAFAAAADALPPEHAATPAAAAARARALAAAGRIVEGAAALAPFAAALGGDLDDAAAAVAIFMAAGDAQSAGIVAEAARRARPDAADSVRILAVAGRAAAAIGAARAGLIADPRSEERALLYANVMKSAGRADEAGAFISELAARSGDNVALAAARRALEESHAEVEGEALASEAAARRAYLGGAGRARAAAELSAALSRIGEADVAIRLSREACFWSGAGKCG